MSAPGVRALFPFEAVPPDSPGTAFSPTTLHIREIKPVRLQVLHELVNFSLHRWRRHIRKVEHGATGRLGIERPVASRAPMCHKHEVPEQERPHLHFTEAEAVDALSG